MTTLVAINNCIVAQLFAHKSIPLGGGPLILEQNATGLILRVGDFAFPLAPQTPVFTHNASPLWYFFKAPGVEKSFVKVTLPPEVEEDGSPAQRMKDQFEEELVKAGMLKVGVEAVGDEVGATIKQDASDIATMLNGTTTSYLSSHPPTEYPIQVPEAAQEAARKVAAGSATVAGYAAGAAEYVAKTAIGVGETAVNVVREATRQPPTLDQKLRNDMAEAGYPADDDLITEEQDEDRMNASAVKPIWNAGKSIFSGISTGTVAIYNAATSAAQSVINHDFGSDAANISSKAGQTAGNVGATMKSVLVDTSPIGIAKRAATGPETKTDDPSQVA